MMLCFQKKIRHRVFKYNNIRTFHVIFYLCITIDVDYVTGCTNPNPIPKRVVYPYLVHLVNISGIVSKHL